MQQQLRQQRSTEILWALVAILLITLLYTGVVVRTGSIPAAGEFFGHSLGVLGFTLMLMTETLYSLRKRSRVARWGRLANWLQFHIFTGLVGPFLVLLHTSWKFNGLAGVVMLLTVIIVVSGVIGRYIYTAVPRTADGAEIQAHHLNDMIREIEREMEEFAVAYPTMQNHQQRLAAIQQSRATGAPAVLGRMFAEWGERLQGWQEQRQAKAAMRPLIKTMVKLARERRALYRQIDTLAAARRMLAVWHSVHIPIGMALFTAALVHILAAIYYATLLR